MKLTDILPRVLTKNDVNHTFGLQGGAVVHIFDSLENSSTSTATTKENRSPQDFSISLEQDIYTGGKFTAEANKAKNQLRNIWGHIPHSPVCVNERSLAPQAHLTLFLNSSYAA